MNLLALLLIVAVRFSYAAKPIETLFNVDTASCGDRLSDGTLQKYVDESAAMAVAAQNIVGYANPTGAKPKNYASAYLRGFFGVKNGDTLIPDPIKRVVDSVVDFLNNGVLGRPDPKAWLFCDSTAFIQKNLEDNAVQNNGMPATDKNDQPVKISKEYRRAIRRTTKNGKSPDVYLLKLPSTPPTYQYYFNQIDPTDPDTDFCGPDKYGVTLTDGEHRPIPVVILCPSTFTRPNAFDTLGSPEPMVAPKGQEQQSLNVLRSKSMTFLHEMYHFAPGLLSPNPIDTGDPEYKLSGILKLDRSTSALNAQSYYYLALGAWYTYNKPLTVQNPQTGVDETRYISYSTGACAYIQGSVP